MPSYLAQLANDDAPLDSTNVDSPPSDKIKARANALDSPRFRNHHHRTQSLDESSAISTHDSDMSSTHPPMHNENETSHGNGNGNGNSTRPTSINSYTNDDVRDTHPTAASSIANGKKVLLPDRTKNQQATAGNDDAFSNGFAQPNLDMLSPSLDPEPLESPVKSAADVSTTSDPQPPAPLDNEFTASSHLLPMPGSASHTAEPVPPSPKTPHGHRFSSPPAYQPGNPTLNSSPSGHLLPPLQNSMLKQRHTLEVPKPSRAFKDGQDTALSTGRFSPTSSAMSGARRASMNLGRRATRSGASEVPRDEVARDEDAARWAEAIRLKRASKRRRKEEEDDDRVLVGTKVDESHANWVTSYNMLTGIRVSVSRTNAKLDRELTREDFVAKQKSTFDMYVSMSTINRGNVNQTSSTGNELVPSAKYDFKFKDYAPWVFRRLRALFRLDPADYLMSLTGKYILSELGSPGKSGSFFYFSRDYRFIIKTIHHSEHKFLRKILQDYFNHVQQNPNTLLSQFYGLHRVKMPYGKKIHFVVMNNLFPPHRDIHTTFDLKGSTIGRDYKEEDLKQNPRATLKDLNWLRRKRHLELGIQKKRLFLQQLRADVVLLKRLQIMDYSLLIGIHDVSRGNDENLRDKTLQVFNPVRGKPAEEEPTVGLHRTPSKLETARKARELRQIIRQERPIPMGQAIDKMPDELGENFSRPGFVFNQDDGGFQATHENNQPADEIYYLGVIDCLTHYGMIKKIEHFWKGLSNDRTQISALPPDQYGDRFYNFVEGITMSSEEAKREEIRREQEAMEARLSGETRGGKTNKHSIPPMPDHLPPLPPVSCEHRAPRDTVDMATKEAQKSPSSDIYLPERTLKTVTVPADINSNQNDRILPVVEELGGSSRDDKNVGGSVSPSTSTGMASALSSSKDTGEGLGQRRFSRGSLDKKLPPLPSSTAEEGNGAA